MSGNMGGNGSKNTGYALYHFTKYKTMIATCKNGIYMITTFKNVFSYHVISLRLECMPIIIPNAAIKVSIEVPP